MRRLPVGLNWALRVVASGGLVLFIAAAAARSQDSGSRLPVEVQSVEMSEASAGEDIVIEAASPVDWIADLEPDGSLVVFLSGSVPGPEALDLSSANGLVSTVGVGFTVVGGVPTTRLAIRTRSSFRYRVVEAGRRLTVEMRPDDQGTPAPTPLPPAETRSVETQPPAESGSRGLRDELLRVRAQAALLERELSTSRGDLEEARRARQSLEARLQEADRQSETYRERASSLHADRLRLIEELRESRAEVAHGVSTDVVAEATEDAERRLAESERAVRGAQEEVTELRRRLEQVESSATASSGTEKRMREELEQLRGELAASRSSEERLRSELATTRSDLERTTGERSLADQAIANDAGDRAVSDALRRSLEESRSSESDLRRWLARAPALLGIESLVVGDAAAPCLSFRPAPSTDSPVLDCIEPGTVLSALMMRPDWMRVRLPDRREGWVSQQYLEPAYKSEMAELTAVRSQDLERIQVLERQRNELIERLKISQATRVTDADSSDSAHREASLRAELADLGTQLSESEAEQVRVAELLAEVRDERDALGQGLQAESRARVEAEAEVAALRQVDRRVDSERSRIDELTSQLQARSAALATVEARAASLETKATSLEAKLAEAEARAAELGSAVEERDGLARRVLELEEGVAGVGDLRRQLAAAETAASDADEKAARLEAEAVSLAEQMAVAEGERSALNARLQEESKARVGLEATLSEAEARVAEFEAGASAAGGAEAELRRQLEAANARATELERAASGREALAERVAELEAGVDATQDLRAELAAATAVASEATGQVAELEAERARLAERLAGAEEERREVNARLQAESEARVGLEAALAEAESRTMKLEGSADDRESLERRLRELESGAVEAADLREKLAAAQRREVELRAELAAKQSLGADVAGLRSELAAAQAALAASRGRVEAAEEAGRERLADLRAFVGADTVVVSALAEPCLNLRAGPDPDSQQSDCLEPGTSLELRGIEGDWAEVVGAGKLYGWVATQFVEPALRGEIRRAVSALTSSRASLAEVEGEREDLAELLAAAEGQRNALSAQLEAESEARFASDSALVADQAKVAESETRAVAAERRESELREQLSAAEARASEAEAQRAELEERTQRFETERSRLESVVADLGGRSAALEEAEAQVTELQEERAGLAERLAAAERERSTLTARLDAEAETRVALGATLSAAEARVAELEAVASAAGGAESELRSQLAAATARAGELEQAAGSAAALEARVAELEAGIAETDDLQGKLLAAEAAANGANVRLAELESERTSLADRLAAAEEERLELSARLDAETGTRAGLEATLSAAEVRASEAEARVAELDGERASLAERLAAAEEERLELSARLDAESKTRIGLEATLSAAEARATDFEGSAEDREISERLVAELESSVVEMAELRRELAAVRTVAAEAERRLIELQASTSTTRPAQPRPTAERSPDAQVVQVEPAASIADPSEEFVSLVGAWAQAWSAQDAEKYLSFYSPGFRPPAGLGRSDWELQRRQRLAAPSFIDVGVSSFRTRVDGPDRGAVVFVQSYRSNTYEDTVTKTLEIERLNGEWKIVLETSE